MEDLFHELLTRIGEDPQREGLLKTPHRAAEAVRFFTRGYEQDLDTILNGAIFEEEYEDVIILKNIEFYSLCEHHLVPFFGNCHVGYLPRGKILGLSKIARVVDMFSRRLQVQERLTHQIARALNDAIQPRGVAVVMQGQHLCMMARGVQKQHSSMVTSALLGHFREDARARAEFMQLVCGSGGAW